MPSDKLQENCRRVVGHRYKLRERAKAIAQQQRSEQASRER